MKWLTDALTWFDENWGRVPEEKPPLIPQRWRIPFFFAVALVSLLLLALLVTTVVVPGIRARQSASPASAPGAKTIKENR